MPAEITPVCHFTEEGHDLIRTNEEIRHAADVFWDAEYPEDSVGGEYLGVGKYSAVRGIGGIVVKISSPTSSEYSYNTGIPSPAEDLTAQYRFLTALGCHMRRQGSGIVVPRQFFVIQRAPGAYMLGQELMRDWDPLERWAQSAFNDAESTEAKLFAAALKDRIRRSVDGTDLLAGLNDLRLDNDDIHGGNILVPRSTKPAAVMPICIIDQPGPKYRIQPAKA